MEAEAPPSSAEAELCARMARASLPQRGREVVSLPVGLDVAPDLKLHAFTASRGELAVVFVSLKVNGTVHRVMADLDTPLLYVLRNDLGLNAAKFGCGLGQCGACTVLIDGAASRSC